MPSKWKNLSLLDIWRICNKIRTAIFRTGVNLWDYFLPNDPDRYNLMSEEKFVSVLAGPLNNAFCLSKQEISDLATYFQAPDGRVLYKQFCQVMQDNVPDFTKCKPLVSGLEWEDPNYVNCLSESEELRVMTLLAKIATIVRERNLQLLPYFKDYEMIAKNNGTITISHFARVLHFLKIYLPTEELRLVVRKFLKDGYTVNYIAFLSALDFINKDMESCGVVNFGEEESIEDILRINCMDCKGPAKPSVKGCGDARNLVDILAKIRQQMFSYRVPLSQFMSQYDPLNQHVISRENFIRSLDEKLDLTPTEKEKLIEAFASPTCPTNVEYKRFCEIVDEAFFQRYLERTPLIQPLQHIACHDGEHNFLNFEERQLVFSALMALAANPTESLIEVFQDFDRHNCGTVNLQVFMRVLAARGLNFIVSPTQVEALGKCFAKPRGLRHEVDYRAFLEAVEINKQNWRSKHL